MSATAAIADPGLSETDEIGGKSVTRSSKFRKPRTSDLEPSYPLTVTRVPLFVLVARHSVISRRTIMSNAPALKNHKEHPDNESIDVK
jgi:hypothetical protein